ncbi:GFA family protein [Rhizobium sp. ARZ01]|uniref:GFA family protein n=1 Tax=Rhizobium sp. ARZ01 TaxID=2769313 RepID=UPI00177FFACC|nr:GFA family protein [Rhizobium sp. ARZ01]MBD9374103.1 GFA family protein [Rhizobium sp. ARZ01]
MHIDGQCHCGYITYEAEIEPGDVAICHCTDCQRLTGSAYRVSTFSRREDFRVTGGEPSVYVKIGESGNRSMQHFCPKCGSPCFRTGEGEGPDEVAIRLGTISQRLNLVPTSQHWRRSALPWVEDLRHIPSCEKE